MEKSSHLTESQLRKSTPKGQFYSYIMPFIFIYEMAMSLGKRNPAIFATLYLLKHCLSELARVRKEVEQRQNIIGH